MSQSDLPWYRRIQFEVGINFRLMPDNRTSWRQHLIDPFLNFVWIGKRLENPRVELPTPFSGACVDREDGPRDDPTGLRTSIWTSRCFWLGFGCRILGLDIGVGIFYRKQNDD